MSCRRSIAADVGFAFLRRLLCSMSKADAQAQYVAALTKMDPTWESKAGNIKSKL